MELVVNKLKEAKPLTSAELQSIFENALDRMSVYNEHEAVRNDADAPPNSIASKVGPNGIVEKE